MQLMEVLLIKSELTRNMATHVTVEYANGAVDTIVRALHVSSSMFTNNSNNNNKMSLWVEGSWFS